MNGWYHGTYPEKYGEVDDLLQSVRTGLCGHLGSLCGLRLSYSVGRRTEEWRCFDGRTECEDRRIARLHGLWDAHGLGVLRYHGHWSNVIG